MSFGAWVLPLGSNADGAPHIHKRQGLETLTEYLTRPPALHPPSFPSPAADSGMAQQQADTMVQVSKQLGINSVDDVLNASVWWES